MQLKFFKNAIRNDSSSGFPDLTFEDGVNFALSVEIQETEVYQRIDDIIVPKEDLLESGWITFSSGNISTFFSEWILRGKENITFKIDVSIESPKLIGALNCVRNPKDPLAIEFVKIKEDSQMDLFNRLRVLEFDKTEHERRKRQERQRCESSLSKEDIILGCHPEDFNIPFALFNVTDILPTEYNARYCTGGCEFPIPESQATFHAQARSFYNARLGANSSVPSCVPTSYTSAQALKKGSHGVYDIVLFANVSVSECGCR